MLANRVLELVAVFCGCCYALSAGDSLTDGQMSLLHDSGGWEYVRMSDQDNGIQTQHTCFDGKPHPNECRGTLILTPDKSFVQKTFIHGQSVERHGTYELDGNQLTFTDELNTADGPYSVEINEEAKSMNLQMPQIKIELTLEKEYRKSLNPPKKDTPQ